jgi:hypothetical protein
MIRRPGTTIAEERHVLPLARRIDGSNGCPLAGLHDRALLLVGFGALRRSELAGLTLDKATDHDRGERPPGSRPTGTAPITNSSCAPGAWRPHLPARA